MKLPSKRNTLIAGSTVAAMAAVAVPVSQAFADDGSDAGRSATPTDEYCSVLAMNSPEGTQSSEGVAVANGGNYFVGTIDDQPVAWVDGGELREIPVEGFTVIDVNAEAMVVGSAPDPDTGAEQAWTYDLDTEELTQLGNPDAESTVLPSAINDNGDVVGNVVDSAVALKWEGGSAEPVELELEEGAGQVADINEDGVAVGSQIVDGTDQSWMWDADGSGSQLPEVAADTEDAQAIAVNGGWALSSPTGDDTQYRWDLNEGGEPQAVEISFATDVDEQGRVFGSHTEDGKELPVRQDDEGVTVLESLAEEPTEDQVNQVLDVSADGDDMTGISTNDDGVSSAAEWGCTA